MRTKKTPTFEHSNTEYGCVRFTDATFLLGWGFKTSIQINDEILIRGLEEFEKFYKVEVTKATVTDVLPFGLDPSDGFLPATGCQRGDYGVGDCELSLGNAPLAATNLYGYGALKGIDIVSFNVKKEDKPLGTSKIDRIKKDQFIITGQIEDYHIADVLSGYDIENLEAAKVKLTLTFTPYGIINATGTEVAYATNTLNDPREEGFSGDYDYSTGGRRLRAVPRILETTTVITVGKTTETMEVYKSARISGHATVAIGTDAVDETALLQWVDAHFTSHIKYDISRSSIFYTVRVNDARVDGTDVKVDFDLIVQQSDADTVTDILSAVGIGPEVTGITFTDTPAGGSLTGDKISIDIVESDANHHHHGEDEHTTELDTAKEVGIWAGVGLGAVLVLGGAVYAKKSYEKIGAHAYGPVKMLGPESLNF